MSLYEHVFIARQDLSNAQAEGLIEHFGQVLTDHGGSVVGSEYWGLKTMAYKINKNRKGHYAFFRLDCDPTALQEMERRQRLHEDILRIMSIKVDGHEEGPSAVMLARNQRDSRGGRDRGPRDRDRDRGPRDRDRGPREDRPRREETASE
ncbi:MAG: 30S ribosomal protein S6 [Pseudomonadota bacterium]